MENQTSGFLKIQEAECSVIGALISTPSSINDVAALLTREDFTIPAHEWIWRAIKYLYDNNTPATIVSISDMLQRYKKLEEAGGLEYLTQLASSYPFASEIMTHAKIIKRESAKRKGVQLAQDIQDLTLEDNFDSEEEYFMLIDSLFNHSRPTTGGNMRGFEETEEDYKEYLTTQTGGVKVGFPAFDEWSGGIDKGWLYILAGRPSVGKTAKALQMAVSIAKQDAGQILFWSQEMTFNQLKNRMISPIVNINYARMRRKELEHHEIDLVMRAHKSLAKTPLYVEDSAGVTIEHVVSTARQRERSHGQVGAIFVDYLTRMNIKQNKGETWSRAVGDVAKRFKWLAQEMNCPVFLLAQLNREGAQGEPKISDLRDSGEIEQEADVIEFLWKDPEDTHSDGVVIQSSIAKGRDTGVSKFRYLFKGWIQKYEELNASESVANIQSYQEDGSTFRKIPNKQGTRSRFSKRNA